MLVSSFYGSMFFQQTAKNFPECQMDLETKWCHLVGKVKKAGGPVWFFPAFTVVQWFDFQMIVASCFFQVVTKVEHVYVHEKGYAPGPKKHQKLGEPAELKMGGSNSWMVSLQWKIPLIAG